jgi:hypothetical protein
MIFVGVGTILPPQHRYTRNAMPSHPLHPPRTPEIDLDNVLKRYHKIRADSEVAASLLRSITVKNHPPQSLPWVCNELHTFLTPMPPSTRWLLKPFLSCPSKNRSSWSRIAYQTVSDDGYTLGSEPNSVEIGGVEEKVVVITRSYI